MVSSGSFDTGSCAGRYLIFSWSISSQSVEDNTSTISWNLKGAGNSGYVICSDFHVVIDGDVVYDKDSSYHVEVHPGTKVASGTKTIYHNSDGSRKFSASVEAGIYQWAANCSGNGSWELITIPRASSLSLSSSSVNVGSSITATISRASSKFTHTVEFYINSSYYQKYTGIDTSQAYTIPSSWYTAMPSSTSCTAYCRITTYNNSTQIGSQVTKSFTVNVPSTIVPTVGTITLDPDDIGGKNILIQNKNKLAISVKDCTAGKGSSIKSYTFSGPGISTTTTNTSITGGPISNTGPLTYTVKVTDNRGRTASETVSITCYEYYAPSFTFFKAYRAKSNGDADVNGTYLKCEYGTKFASVNSNNSVSVKIYGIGDPMDTSGGSLLINLNGDTTSTYQVYAKVIDVYGGNASSSTITVFGETRILNITQDGTGVAIGKMAENNNLFECRWDAKFDGTASGPSGFSTSSDIDVDIVDNLQPIQYELVQSNDNKIHYGFVAQDVEKLLSDAGLNPELTGIIGQIQNNGQQEYVLTYTEFIPLLTKKCQELQAEINILKEEISELKSNTT